MLKTLKKEIAAINKKLMAKESLKDDVKLVHEGQDFFETFDKLTPG